MVGRTPDNRRYYLVLFGNTSQQNGLLRIEVDGAYLLAKAQEIATSAAAWYEASTFVAEISAKVDIGLQGKIEGILWGVKGKVDINVVKAELVTGQVNLRDPAAFAYDYAGKTDKTKKHGTTKISNGIGASLDIPWLPKTPWGPIAIGAAAEQSQLIDGELLSHDFKQDWGVYAVVPVAQPKKMSSIGEKMQKDPLMNGAGDGPSLGSKAGKQEDFYGLDAGVGAALILGIEVKGKVGLKK